MKLWTRIALCFAFLALLGMLGLSTPAAHAATTSQVGKRAPILRLGPCIRTVTFHPGTSQAFIKHYACSAYPAFKSGVKVDNSTYGCWVPDNDTVCSYVSYTFSQDYSHVNIEYIELTGQTSQNALYWDHCQYAGSWWGAGGRYIGTNTLYQGIWTTKTAGYYFEPWVKTSSGNNWYWDIALN